MVKKRKSGYTLLEMMIVVAILGVLAGAGANLMLQVNRYFILTRTRLDLQREARAAMYVITRQLRQGQSASVTIDSYSASQPYYSRITFTKIQGQSVSFYQNGNKLVQLVNNQSMTLSKNLAYLGFTFPRSDDLSILSVSMTLQENIYEGRSKALHMASERVQVMN